VGTPDAASPLTARVAPMLGWLSLTLAVLATVMAVWLWQRLDRTQMELAKQSAAAAEDAHSARSAAEQAQNLTQTLQARLAIAEVKLSEVSLQRSQLEELMLSVSRSRDDTLVLDIESGLRLAIQQAELTGSVQPLVAALVAADKRISKAAQPRLNPVQRAVARDIERIRSASVTDVPALAQRLDELVRLADELQLINAPLRERSRPPASSGTGRGAEASGGGHSATPITTESRSEEAQEPSALGQGWAQVSAFWHGIWVQTVRSATHSLGDLVRVGRIDRPEAVLLAPEQAFFLRENLKLKVLNARLGLMSRQLSVIRTDLGAVRHMLATYFDPQDPSTRQALQALSDVLQASKMADIPRPDETLTALAAAAGGR
jgi:uroporphyrin-III C-methyltransferase